MFEILRISRIESFTKGATERDALMAMGRSGRGRAGKPRKALNSSDSTSFEEDGFDRVLEEQNEAESFFEDFLSNPAESDLQNYQFDSLRKKVSLSFDDLREEYAALWAEMAIRKDNIDDADRIVDKITENKGRYQIVEAACDVPWYVIAVIHSLEASGKFNRHLHNGDPLTAKTVNVPPGRPLTGEPPFSWEESALDALQYDGLIGNSDWSIEHIMYVLERFNGWGYRKYHPEVKSPYLWSFSNHYLMGKYVADGKWSSTTVSKQCGSMVIVRRLVDGGHISLFRDAGQNRNQQADLPRAEKSAALEDKTFDFFPRDGARIASRRSWPVQSQLVDGPGIFGYYPANRRWGTTSTIDALNEVGRIWLLRHQDQHPRVPVGDISLKGGGDIDGHASHETGRDVDMRPFRSDGKEGPVRWQDIAYSGSLTQELIDIIYCNGIVKVKVIGFNDPNIQGCVNWANHDNHLHVRFFFEDEAPGYPILQIGLDNNPAVREFQRRLNVWLRQLSFGKYIAEDGKFGQMTLEATLAFQDALGLAADGDVGRNTWEASLSFIG